MVLLRWVFYPEALIDFISWVEHLHIIPHGQVTADVHHHNGPWHQDMDLLLPPSPPAPWVSTSSYSWLHLTSVTLWLRYKMLPINCDLWPTNYQKSQECRSQILDSNILTPFIMKTALNPGDKFSDRLPSGAGEAGIWLRMKLLYWRRTKNDLCDCNLSLGLFYSLFLSELLARL